MAFALDKGWGFLLAAGFLEIICTTVFRYVDGFNKPAPLLLFFALGAMSLYLLNRSIAYIPLGTAYAVWTGIGAAGTVLVGIMFFSEPSNALRLFCIAAIVAAIIGLKFGAMPQ